jgi:hypothetical protein
MLNWYKRGKMDESKLLRLINYGQLAYGEKRCAKQMHYSFFVTKDRKQVKFAYYSYQTYLSNLNANANSIFVNQELSQEMQNLFINLNSLPDKNQKE